MQRLKKTKMFNIKKVLSVDTLKNVVYLGGGSYAAEWLGGEAIAGKVFTDTNEQFKPVVPLVAGVAAYNSSGHLAKTVGAGMIANAAGKLIGLALAKAGVDTGVAMQGTDVMMGSPVMMSSTYAPAPTASAAPAFSSDYSNEMAY